MTTPRTPRDRAHHNLNHLRRGITYLATTTRGTTVGEYLGMETSYGDKAILLRHGAGTESLTIDTVCSIRRVAA